MWWFSFRAGVDVWCLCYYILYYTIIHYYYYILHYTYTIILYIILYYTLPLPIFILYLSVLTYTYLYSSTILFLLPSQYLLSLFLSPLQFSSSSFQSPIFILYLSVLTYTYLYSIRIFISHPPAPIFYSIIPHSSSHPHSFYTCRYLHILIYIIPILPNHSNPNPTI